MRQLLAAYRRDDWSPGDVALLREHLTTCAECRRVEAAYREVGERVRRLPSIAPPPEFREAVFAAIRAEERRVAPGVVQLSQAATNPELPVVRPVRQPRRLQRRRELSLGQRIALVAAAIVLALAAARFLPDLVSFGRILAGLPPLPQPTNTPAASSTQASTHLALPAVVNGSDGPAFYLSTTR